LTRLHFITRTRKVTTILEFGVGKSTAIFGSALLENKSDFFEFTNRNLRRGNLYQAYALDNYASWIE